MGREEVIAILTKYTGRYGSHLDYVLEELAHAGVVLKVEGELPDKWHMEYSEQWEGTIIGRSRRLLSTEFIEGYDESQQDMLKAGYVKTEPLIVDI